MSRYPQMHFKGSLLLALVLTVLSLAGPWVAAGETQIKLDDNHQLLAAIPYKNLSVWPVTAKTVEDLKDVISLQKAQENKAIDIREIGTGEAGQAGGGGGRAQVNSLVIENKGKATVMVLAGTILKGGKQDRQIGQDFLIKPGQTVSVDSFCVEHGRWNENRQVSDLTLAGAGGSDAAGVMGVPAQAAVQPAVQQRQEQVQTATNVQPVQPNAAPQAQARPVQPVVPSPGAEEHKSTGGKFEAQSSMSNYGVRASGQYAKNQTEVWNKVATTNSANATAPQSGTLMATKVKLANDEDRKAIVALLAEKLKAVEGQNVVGLAYAINGEIVNVRYFLAPSLYASFAQPLIETIADDTVTRNAELGAEKVAAYVKAPKAFAEADFHGFMYDQRKQKEVRTTKAANRNSYYENNKAYSSETVGTEGALENKVISADYTSKN